MANKIPKDIHNPKTKTGTGQDKRQNTHKTKTKQDKGSHSKKQDEITNAEMRVMSERRGQVGTRQEKMRQDSASLHSNSYTNTNTNTNTNTQTQTQKK
jgi:hypothetical protein